MTFKVGAMVIDIYGIHLPGLATDTSSQLKARVRDGGHYVTKKPKQARAGNVNAAFLKFLGASRPL